MIDYKAYLKAIRLTNAQKRLFNALTSEPTPHIHSQHWQSRHYLTSGGTRSALRRLTKLGLVAKIEGVWRVANPGMGKWWATVLNSALGDSDPQALDLQFGESHNLGNAENSKE